MAHQLRGVDETETRGGSPSLFPDFFGHSLCGFVDTALDEDGRRSGDRTRDNSCVRAVLYRLSYPPKEKDTTAGVDQGSATGAGTSSQGARRRKTSSGRETTRPSRSTGTSTVDPTAAKTPISVSVTR